MKLPIHCHFIVNDDQRWPCSFNNAYRRWVSVNINSNISLLPDGWAEPSLVQVTAWHRTGDKSSATPMLINCKLEPILNKLLWNFKIKIQKHSLKKCLKRVRYFDPVSVCYFYICPPNESQCCYNIPNGSCIKQNQLTAYQVADFSSTTPCNVYRHNCVYTSGSHHITAVRRAGIWWRRGSWGHEGSQDTGNLDTLPVCCRTKHGVNTVSADCLAPLGICKHICSDDRDEKEDRNSVWW